MLRSQRQLRRSNAGWRTAGGEAIARWVTNLFRLRGTTSLWSYGEVQNKPGALMWRQAIPGCRVVVGGGMS